MSPQSGLARAGNRKRDSRPVNLTEELLAVLLHDIRSPLGAIGVLTDLLAANSKSEQPTDPRLVQMLADAVSKARLVMDDAVEIQSVIRGTSTLNKTKAPLDSIVTAVLAKARNAPYYKETQIRYDRNDAAKTLVSVDIEKAEMGLLCVLEQVIGYGGNSSVVNISQSINHSSVILRILSAKGATDENAENSARPPERVMGRLGTRKPGESRYGIRICGELLGLMAGELRPIDESGQQGFAISFSLAGAGKNPS